MTAPVFSLTLNIKFLIFIVKSVDNCLDLLYNYQALWLCGGWQADVAEWQTR